jgi:putative endonuclease
MSDSRRSLGQNGEKIAAAFLQRRGYMILVRNYRRRVGEIDIIAREGEVLVFIEVKTRASGTCGSPAAAVTPRKQRQISRTAQYYLAEQNLFDAPARFDVVTVVFGKDQQSEIELIANAFDLCE